MPERGHVSYQSGVGDVRFPMPRRLPTSLQIQRHRLRLGVRQIVKRGLDGALTPYGSISGPASSVALVVALPRFLGTAFTLAMLSKSLSA